MPTGTFRKRRRKCLLLFPKLWGLLQIHNQFNGMMRCVFKDTHVIHHILDQEQAPAARRLQSGKFGLDVWFNRIAREKASTSMVNDAHQERFIRSLYCNSNGLLWQIMVAVFHGIHRCFSYGSFQLLQTFLGEMKW